MVALAMLASMQAPAQAETQAETQTAITVPEPGVETALPDMLRYLASPELRDRYPLMFQDANRHVVSPTQAGVAEGFDLFFASYPGEVPSGLQVVVIAYEQSGGQSGGQSGEIYQCPDAGDTCRFDPNRPRAQIPSDDLWLYGSHNVDSRRLGMRSNRPDVYKVKTDRNGRMEGTFRAMTEQSSGALQNICLTLDFYEKRFFGLSEAEPVTAGLYCYNIALKRVTTSIFEQTFGYIPDEKTRLQLRADFEAIIGAPLPAD